ncbi:membrane protein insertase YidC [Agrilactobacillus fermenti]|uniref:membrane protein insertase YidC n=1 Tax=Agrilactobacillus fermenti TaxID=2586909 RepID=UPI001E59CDC4|nr:membrane protein insertase YidC [Agrilactobacillus fermenti]MCD2256684.1 membrane protein insertase YidC [Agrilactobacillus fermenti]
MKQKKIKYLLLICSAFALMFILSGCSFQNFYKPGQKPPSGFFYGTLYNGLAVPMQHLINWTADKIGGPSGYGWGILIITFVVRLIILPLMLVQSKKSTIQQEKVQRIQPQLQLIQKQMKKNNSQAAQAKLGQLQMDVYKKNDLSLTGGMGCLPLIIQFPIMIGIFQAVMYSPEISSAHFLGINLGRSNLVVVIVATLFYALQSYLMLLSVPEAQKQAMRVSAMMGPITTFIFALIAPAGLGLYFLVGGLIVVIQQIIVTFWMTPRIKKQIDTELKNKPIVEVVNEQVIESLDDNPAATTQTNSSETAESLKAIHERNRQRNAGKQNRPR